MQILTPAGGSVSFLHLLKWSRSRSGMKIFWNTRSKQITEMDKNWIYGGTGKNRFWLLSVSHGSSGGGVVLPTRTSVWTSNGWLQWQSLWGGMFPVSKFVILKLFFFKTGRSFSRQPAFICEPAATVNIFILHFLKIFFFVFLTISYVQETPINVFLLLLLLIQRHKCSWIYNWIHYLTRFRYKSVLFLPVFH